MRKDFQEEFCNQEFDRDANAIMIKSHFLRTARKAKLTRKATQPSLALGVEVCQRIHVSAAALSRESFLYYGNCTMGEGRCVFFGGSEMIIIDESI